MKSTLNNFFSKTVDLTEKYFSVKPVTVFLTTLQNSVAQILREINFRGSEFCYFMKFQPSKSANILKH